MPNVYWWMCGVGADSKGCGVGYTGGEARLAEEKAAARRRTPRDAGCGFLLAGRVRFGVGELEDLARGL